MAETVSAAQLEAQFKALRLQGRIADVRQALHAVVQRGGAEAAWARQQLAAHDERWWALASGRRCRLRRRAAQDLALVRRLWSAPGFAESFNAVAPPLPADDAALARILALEHASLITHARSLHWVIETLDGQGFGVASVVDIHLAHKRAEFLVGVVAPPYAGAAAEASLLAIDFVFVHIGLNKLVSLVALDNAPSQAGARHLGFRSEGVLRQHAWHPRTGRPIDFEHLALLAGDEAAQAAQRRVRQRLLHGGKARFTPDGLAAPARPSASPETPTPPAPTP